VVDSNMLVSFNKYCHCQHLPGYKKRENGAAQWRCAGVFYSKNICLWLRCRSWKHIATGNVCPVWLQIPWDSLIAESCLLVIIISSFCSSLLVVMKFTLWVTARLFNQAHMKGSCRTPLSMPVLSRTAPTITPRSILCECYGLLKLWFFIMFIWHSWEGFDFFN